MSDNQFFVYYSDDYIEIETGGIGLHECGTLQEAENFIADRMKVDARIPRTRYLIIKGKILDCNPSKVIL
jgi:hypothetical protein